MSMISFGWSSLYSLHVYNNIIICITIYALGYYNCWSRLGSGHTSHSYRYYSCTHNTSRIRASRCSAHDSLKYTTAAAFAIHFHALSSGREWISKTYGDAFSQCRRRCSCKISLPVCTSLHRRKATIELMCIWRRA